LLKKELKVIGTGEISLLSYTNLKQKKTLISKKWYNISTTQNNNAQKESNYSLTKRGLNSANFALSLINTIKVHLKITETITDNGSFALSSPNTNATEAEEFNSKSAKENINFDVISISINNKDSSNNSHKSSGIVDNNSLIVNSLNNFATSKLKSEFEELKDVKDLFDYKSNVARDIRNRNLNSGLIGIGSISNNNTNYNINVNSNNNNGGETSNYSNNGNKNISGNNINNKEILNGTNGFNNFKEKSAILSKSNLSSQNNAKKAKQDVSLSQSLNSSNFLVIKNSLNNSIIGHKGEEMKTSNFINTNKINNEKEKKETKDIKEKSSNHNKTASQSISNSHTLKKKNVSMIDTNIKGALETLQQQQSNFNKSPKNKGNIATGKAKEVNLNTVRSTTNKNSVTIDYNGNFFLLII
jgi:hypothetical protein